MEEKSKAAGSITAVVPVKANSSSLLGKNILTFGGFNLLIHKIEQLKQVEKITDIVVSSDSDIIEKFIVRVPNRIEISARSAYYAASERRAA